MSKLYYSISEVAKMFKVNESAIRHWEKEFEFIKPDRTESRTRRYGEKDIQNIKIVVELLKSKKMTIEGAKKFLKSNPEKSINLNNVKETLNKTLKFLKGVEKELNNLKKE